MTNRDVWRGRRIGEVVAVHQVLLHRLPCKRRSQCLLHFKVTTGQRAPVDATGLAHAAGSGWGKERGEGEREAGRRNDGRGIAGKGKGWQRIPVCNAVNMIGDHKPRGLVDVQGGVKGTPARCRMVCSVLYCTFVYVRSAIPIGHMYGSNYLTSALHKRMCKCVLGSNFRTCFCFLRVLSVRGGYTGKRDCCWGAGWGG